MAGQCHIVVIEDGKGSVTPRQDQIHEEKREINTQTFSDSQEIEISNNKAPLKNQTI